MVEVAACELEEDALKEAFHFAHEKVCAGGVAAVLRDPHTVFFLVGAPSFPPSYANEQLQSVLDVQDKFISDVGVPHTSLKLTTPVRDACQPPATCKNERVWHLWHL